MQLSYKEIELELKVNWAISRSTSTHKKNYIVEISDKEQSGIGEIAPNIRYGETHDLIKSQLLELRSCKNLSQAIMTNDYFHSLQNGVSRALSELAAKNKNIGLSEFFNLKKASPRVTSFSIPIMELDLLPNYLQKHPDVALWKLKIGEDSTSLVHELAKLTDLPICIDANEGFSSEKSLMSFLESIQNYKIEFLEQPYPASEVELYQKLKKQSPFAIIGDESIENEGDFDLLATQFHGLNFKLMKTGGIARALQLIEQAKARGLKIMLGCMIETSLGISDALRMEGLADYLDLDGHLLIKDDPFQILDFKKGQLSFRDS